MRPLSTCARRIAFVNSHAAHRQVRCVRLAHLAALVMQSTLRAQTRECRGTYDPNHDRLCPRTKKSGIEFAQLGCMASRDFADATGMSWRVWNTVPISGAVINPGFEKGWLTFESDDGSLRRLAPVPPGWEELSEERLRLLLRNSNAVPRHTGPMRRVDLPASKSDAPDRA